MPRFTMFDPNADCVSRCFEEQYANHRNLAYAVALRLLGNHFEAEDVTQEAFLRLLLKPTAFRGGNFEAWLTRLTHNCAIDILRKRRPALLGTIPPEAVPLAPIVAPTLEEHVVSGELAAVLSNAIAALKLNERRAIRAAFIDGLTHEQIARSQRVPLGTVKTRIRASLRKMRANTAMLGP